MGRKPGRLMTKDCKQIPISLLKKRHFFDGGVREGRISFGSDEKTAEKITFVVSTVEGEEFFRIQHKEGIFIPQIVSTPCNFGGRRWWFICPVVDNAYVCNRRVSTLYFGKGNSFGCRHCLHLTYESQREFHKFDRCFLNREKGEVKKLRKILSNDRGLRGLLSWLKAEEDSLMRQIRSKKQKKLLTQLLTIWRTKENKYIKKKDTDTNEPKEIIEHYKALEEQLNERRSMSDNLLDEALADTDKIT